MKGREFMRKSLCLLAIMLMLMGLSPRVGAQAADAEKKPAEAKAEPASDLNPAKEESSVTDHTIRLGGQAIPYKATAGTILLKNDKGEPTGLMYSVAYTRSDVKDASQRPISFLYNGGPGSATIWLHMGAFGPRRVYTVDAQFTPPAPYKLVDNMESLLDKTDMVFIDRDGHRFQPRGGQSAEQGFLRR